MAGTANKTMKISDKEAFRVLGLPLGVDKEAIMKKYKSLSIKLSASKTLEDKKRLELVVAAYNRLLPPPAPPQHHPNHHHHHHHQLRPNHKGQSGPCNGGDSEGSSEEDGRVLCRNGDARSSLFKDAAEMTEEEKERKKAEKKRAKKKRQKEKKKLEKIETKILGQKDVNCNRKREESPSDEEEEDEEEEEEEEEEDEEEGEEAQGIDPNSAFVAAAAAKRGVLGGGLARERPPRPTPPPPAPPHHHHHHHAPRITTATTTTTTTRGDGSGQEAAVPDATLVKACQLARRGNEAASVGQYIAAVKLYSDAIALDSHDHRFLGNRSFCLNQLGHHDKALEDADRAVILAPQWDKGHFRRGTSLKDLGRYVEAEVAFEEVLRLDPGCWEAQEEVVRVRVARITEMGFTESQAVGAVAKYSSVQPALDALLAGEFKDVIEDVLRSGNSDDLARKMRVMVPRDVKMNPQNPEGLTSLWVGNVVPEVTEKSLAQLFASQGQVMSVRLLRDKYCAFVNYSDKGAAGRAMAELQGREFCGQKLLIKFPDNPINASFHNSSNSSNGGLGSHHHHSQTPNYHGAIRRGNGAAGGGGGGGFPQPSALLSSAGSSAASSSASSSSSSSPAPSSSSSVLPSSAHKNTISARGGGGGGGEEQELPPPPPLPPLPSPPPPGSIYQTGVTTTFNTTTTVPLIVPDGGVNIAGVTFGLIPPPPHPQPLPSKLRGPVNGDECYFWRTTGCKFGNICKHRHISEHCGVDRKSWQK